MRAHIDRLTESVCPRSLFPQTPSVAFSPQEDCCVHCNTALNVRKTNTRKILTLHVGQIRAKETVLICPQCERVYYSPELRALVPVGGNFGYDVMVHIGNALFLQHRTSAEIVAELTARNIPISSSEVDYLGKKFIVYLAIAHRQSSSKIKEAMRMKGGYMLHLDATFDGQGPMLMTGLDSITDIVLGNVKLPSEKAEKIIPFLQNIKRRFGNPIALVHDMGTGILRAVEKVFENVPDFICHYHFLRDIGKDLLGREYDRIRKYSHTHRITTKLRNHARELRRMIDENPSLVDSFCRAVETSSPPKAPRELLRAVSAYSLIQWILDGKNQGRGYGFPFDRPYVVLAQRLCSAFEQLGITPKPKGRGVSRVARTIYKLSRDLRIISSDKYLRDTIIAIEERIIVFDELRDAMRIAPKTGRDGLNCDGADTNIQTIEKTVNEFCRRLRANPKMRGKKEYKTFLEQIDKYRDKLFSDPIVADTPSGQITIQPQRTNNILERFFRDMKRGYRRRTGNKSMGKTIKAMIADTPLVKNLDNPQYMDILLDGKSTLQERFAELDIQTVRREIMMNQEGSGKIPSKLKNIIKHLDFLQKFSKIFRPRAQSA